MSIINLGLASNKLVTLGFGISLTLPAGLACLSDVASAASVVDGASISSLSEVAQAVFVTDVPMVCSLRTFALRCRVTDRQADC